MALANEIQGVRAHALTDIADALRSFRDRWAAYRVYRKTRFELDRLSTRELDDLGLSRSMIESVSREAAGL